MSEIKELYDAVIVGAGPAGLTAALYLARARYRVLVVEKEHFGGQITITSEVVNYPGVERASGSELTDIMRRQALNFGAEFLIAEVTGLDMSENVKVVQTNRGEKRCFGILLATGARPRMIGFKGEKEFRGRGVAYCATCDGEFFAGKDVFVIGGGFAAAEESVFLTKYARKVTILIRGDGFSCALSAAQAAQEHEKITVLTHTQVEEVAGDTVLRYLRYRNTVTGEVTEYRPPEGDTFGVFVFAGYEPATELIHGLADMDSSGYIVTDRAQHTSVQGLYAAGDVCIKSLRQVVTAVSDGALAATEMERWAAEMQRKTGLHPVLPEQRSLSSDVKESSEGETIFSSDMLSQLETVFEKMSSHLILRLYLDGTPLSEELRGYMEQLCALTDKLSTEIDQDNAIMHRPCVRIYRSDGSWSGLAFHGVPGGHEFTSFILGLYNAAGPGQSLDEGMKLKIQDINRPISMRVFVSLSCTMCPELVTAAQKIAAENSQITAEIYDLNHFPDLREKYHVMSVPCLVVDEEEVSFGKKNIGQVLELLKKRNA